MIDFERLEATIRRDPGERGPASYRDEGGRWLCAGHLKRAAYALACQDERRALIVTGFCILTDEGPVAETDGPPGAIYLTDRLRQAGFHVVVATDRYAAPLLRAGFDAAQITAPLVLEFPVGADSADAQAVAIGYRREMVFYRQFTHLISIERVGPSHDEMSIDEAAKPEFLARVPAAEQGVCRNMRGISIDRYTAPLHLLFEGSRTAFEVGKPPPPTIGIIDGGNEIGSGTIPWSELRPAIKKGPVERTACRIPTDSTIVAGVSNWGAYALGAALAAQVGGSEVIDGWTSDRLRAVIEGMVREGGAVDGVTKRREATVDGLPLEVELGMLDEIHSLVRNG